MTVAEGCGAHFLVAVLPSPAEAYYGLREPATDAFLDSLGIRRLADKVVDTRDGIPLGSNFFLSAYDYPNASGASAYAAAIAPRIVALSLSGHK